MRGTPHDTSLMIYLLGTPHGMITMYYLLGMLHSKSPSDLIQKPFLTGMSHSMHPVDKERRRKNQRKKISNNNQRKCKPMKQAMTAHGEKSDKSDLLFDKNKKKIRYTDSFLFNDAHTRRWI